MKIYYQFYFRGISLKCLNEEMFLCPPLRRFGVNCHVGEPGDLLRLRTVSYI